MVITTWSTLVKQDVNVIWESDLQFGSVMNPNDHPHGGGEGKTGIGRPGPCTPWGKPALGLKTRKKNKASNKMIVRRRDGKAIK